jgi:SAM-dependent methyltransferase
MTDPTRRHLKTTFNEDAELYDRARPDYPEQIFDDLVALASLPPDASLLEIGCGTGKATVPMAERGFRITCVELGENLASVARRNLAPFPDVRIVVAPFETWDPTSVAQACPERSRRGPSLEPHHGSPFDLVYAATCWDWIDSDVRYRKASEVLKPRGKLAIIGCGHAFPKDADRFFFDIQDIYREIGEDIPGEQWPPPAPEDLPDFREEIGTSGLFGDVQARRYVWEVNYTAEEYIDLLNTFSGHIAMDPEKRDFLYRHVRERINSRPDSRVRRHWLAILNLARKA